MMASAGIITIATLISTALTFTSRVRSHVIIILDRTTDVDRLLDVAAVLMLLRELCRLCLLLLLVPSELSSSVTIASFSSSSS